MLGPALYTLTGGARSSLPLAVVRTSIVCMCLLVVPRKFTFASVENENSRAVPILFDDISPFGSLFGGCFDENLEGISFLFF